MKLNMQKDKYTALRTTSEKTLRRLAKGYGMELPKNIKNVGYYGKRLSKFIEDKQFENYEQNLGINAPISGHEKQLMNLAGESKTKVEIKQDVRMIKQLNKDVKSLKNLVKKGVIEIEDLPLEAQNMINKGYDTFEGFINRATKHIRENPNIPLETLEYLSNGSYVNDIFDNMNKNFQFYSEDKIDKFKKALSKKSLGYRLMVGKKFTEKFHLVYESYINPTMSISERVALMDKIVDETLQPERIILEKYTSNGGN